mgnify:CR=1 FL=1
MKAIKPMGNFKIISQEEARRDIASYRPAAPAREPPSAPATPPITETQPTASASVTYKNLVWEHPAYREQGETDKKLLTYDASLARVVAASYERHPSPAEIMSLIIDGLEGKLNADEKQVYDDMLVSYGEWTNIVVQVKEENRKQILNVYENVTGLVWNGSKYVQDNFHCANQCKFDITSIELNKFVDLHKFPDDLVQYLYTRSFTNLPRQMQTGSGRAQIYLPLVEQIRPVGRGYFSGRFNFLSHDYVRASRGVNAAARKN